MDLNTALLWFIGASGVLALEQLWETGFNRGRLAQLGVVAATMGLAVWLVPAWSGFILLPVWLVVELLPPLAEGVVGSLLHRQRYVAASWLSRIVAWLRPFGETRRLPGLVRGLVLMESRDQHAALEQLRSLMQGETPLSHMARVLVAAHSGDWPALIAWIHDPCTPRSVLDQPLILEGYLRALGETGRPGAMLIELQRLVLDSRQLLPPLLLDMTKAEAAAFAGEVELTIELLGKAPSDLQAGIRDFWQATALQAAGRNEEAALVLQHLVEFSHRRPLAQRAERRLAQPVRTVTAGALSPEAVEILRKLRRGGTADIVAWPSPVQSHIRMTLALAATMLVVFLAEIPIWVPVDQPLVLDERTREAIGWKLFEVPAAGGRWEVWFPGGSQWEPNLVELGARLVPVELEEGEWWRIVTAAFLHFGPIHFLMNTLALGFLGMRLERTWGSLFMLGCFLLGACGATGLAPLFMWEATLEEPTILVGASGGAMALIGGILAHTGWWWGVGGNRELGRQFRILALIVVMQSAFDFNTPHISAASHLIGLALGLAYGAVLSAIRERRNVGSGARGWGAGNRAP